MSSVHYEVQNIVELPPQRRWQLFLDQLLHKYRAVEDPQASIMARMAIRLPHVKHNKAPYPMAVSVQSGKYALHYNLDWLKTVPFWEFKIVLIHEMLHIQMYDIPRGIKQSKSIPEELRAAAHYYVINIAADFAVNSQIQTSTPDIERMVHTPGALPPQADLPWDWASEEYFDVLYQRFKKNVEMFKASAASVKQKIQEALDDAESESSGGGGSGGKNKEDADGEGNENSEEKDGDEDGDGGGGGGSGDSQEKSAAEKQKEVGDHAAQKAGHLWDNLAESLTPEELEIAEQMLEAQAHSLLVDAAMDHKKQIGSLPADYQGILDAIFAEATIPWLTMLRQYVTASLRASRRLTMRYPHRRKFLLLDPAAVMRGETVTPRVLMPRYPGVTVNRTYCVLWVEDTSGSMSQEEIVEGLSELRGMQKQMQSMKIYIAQCDTRISSIVELDQGMSIEQYASRIGRTSYGGTAFEDPMLLARATHAQKDYPPLSAENLHAARNMKPVDVVIYHTDGHGYTVSKDSEPPCRVIWCLTKYNSLAVADHTKRQQFGITLKVN